MLAKLKANVARVGFTLFALVLALGTTVVLSEPALALPCASCGGSGGGGTGGGGSGGGTTGNGYYFVPIRATTIDIEDAWPDWKDEPNVYYGDASDKVQFGYVTWAGDVRTDLPRAAFTGSTITIDLWERDNNWVNSNYLGQKTATITQLGQENEFTFSGPGYAYQLRYKVVRG